MQSNTRRALRAILKSSATVMGALLIAPAHADPLGGRVATGSASISNTANTTTVRQTSEGVVIDWSSFNVGTGQTMTFAQPNAQAIAVNRIGGYSASQIFGTVDANGRLVLVNGNGILFGKNSQVDVGSLVATSSGGGDNDLLAGKFSRAGSANSSIVNDGKIVTSQGGLVALVAANVTNNGTVDAKLGTVSLGGATNFTVDFAGDGLVAFAATSVGSGQVANTGSLQGANITMTTRTAEGLASGVVNVGGIIEAQAANGNGGTIILDSGGRGSIDVTGTLDASGKSGGTILIGGDIHGGTIPSDDFSRTPIEDAATTTVAKGALIRANGSAGAGGNIVVWSNGRTSFNGEISAEGGAGSNGGFAEVSSHDVLAFTGTADLLASKGKTGTLLLDPENVAIVASTTEGGSFNGGTPNTFIPTEGDSILNTIDLENALSTSNVIVTTGTTGSQAGNITVASPFGWTSGNTLTLDAAGAVDVDAPVTISGAGKLVLTTGTGVTGGYNFDLGPAGFGGDISFTGGPSSGEALTINGASYTLLYSMSAVQAINASNAALGGRYALAMSLDASSIANWVPLGTGASGSTLNSGKGFSGTFEGLGNGISGLSVDEPSISDVGLFGYSSGMIRDVDLNGGAFIGANSVGALVGHDAGEIENTYSDSAVTGVDYVGGLVGYNLDTGSANQTILDSYATGTITGTLDIGGLVGANVATSGGNAIVNGSYATGTIDDTSSSANNSGGLVGSTDHSGTGNSIVTASYATGSVNGGTDVGGLVGSNAGAISYSYSMGAVSSTATNVGTYIVGGLVGENNGTIAQSYSTSPLIFGSSAGGLVGYDGAPAGSIASSYWDTQTSGLSGTSEGAGNISNDRGITGLSTGQLQGSLPHGFSSLSWATGSDLFPYLLWQFPSGTPQSVSGDIGGCCFTNPGQYVNVQVNGANATSLSGASGYGGYYYVLLPPGTISSGGSGVLAYLPGPDGGVSFVDDAKSSVTSLDIDFAALTETSAAENFSTIAGAFATAIGTNASLQSQIAGLSPFTIDDSATNFTVDAPIDGGTKSLTINADNLSIDAQITASTVTLDATGTIAEATAGFIYANSLSGGSTGGTALTNNNHISQLSTFTNSGSGGFSLTDGETMTVVDDDVINAGDGNLDLSVIGAGHTLSLFNGDFITSGTATLTSAGSITQESGVGTVQAATLTGSAASGATLDGNNLVATLGTFSTGTGGLVLVDATSLTVSRAIDTRTAALELSTTGYSSTTTNSANNLTVENKLTGGTVTLDAGDNLTETGSGTVHATTLIADAGSSVALGGANVLANLSGSSTNGSAGSFSVVDVGSMNATDITSQDTITLTTKGTGHNITVSDLETLTPYLGTITLDSAGTISESGVGIYTNTLNGSSVGGFTLNGGNSLTSFGNITNSGAGGINLNDESNFNISEELNAGAGPLTLGGGDIGIVTGGQLDTTGTLTLTATDVEQTGGAVNAGTLVATVFGEILLGSGNAIANLGAVSAGQSITLGDNRSLSIKGAVTSTHGSVSILTRSGGIVVGNVITADDPQYGTVQLDSAGAMAESGAGIIDATSLEGSSAGYVHLMAANAITNLFAFTTGSGEFSLTDEAPLNVIGVVNSGAGTLSLTTGSGDTLAIDSALVTTGTMNLSSGANIAESGGGAIDAGSLSGSSMGNVELPAANAIINLAAFTTGGGEFSLTDGTPLNVVGVVNSGAGTLSLTTGSGDALTIDGTLATTGTMDLSSGANIVESTSGGVVDANKLNVTAKTGIELESTLNDIVTIGTDTTASGPNQIDQH